MKTTLEAVCGEFAPPLFLTSLCFEATFLRLTALWLAKWLASDLKAMAVKLLCSRLKDTLSHSWKWRKTKIGYELKANVLFPIIFKFKNCSKNLQFNVTHTFCIGKIGSISHRQKWGRKCRFEYLVLCVFSKGCIIISTNWGANEFLICIVMHPFAVVAHIRVVCTRLFADSSSYLFSFSIAETYDSKNVVIDIDRYVAHLVQLMFYNLNLEKVKAP